MSVEFKAVQTKIFWDIKYFQEEKDRKFSDTTEKKISFRSDFQFFHVIPLNWFNKSSTKGLRF